jgi:predicted nuclease with TOPRIM domain
LINFIRDYFVNDLDSDFFESLKERLFCDIEKPNTPIPYERWTQKSHYISREEIEIIFSILESGFQKEDELLDQIGKLIEENSQIKMERDEMASQNQILRARIISFQKENLNLNEQISSLQVQNQHLINDIDFKEGQNNELQSTVSEL